MNAKRIAVTGHGIISSIGTGCDEVTHSLRDAKSGIKFDEDFAQYNFRCQVSGQVPGNPADILDRRTMRFMGPAAAYAYVAAEEAIKMSGLSEAELKSTRTAVVAGSGGGSFELQVGINDIVREKGPKRVGPLAVPKTMGSTVSANLATLIGLQGLSYSISSACSTGAHCIGHGAQLIMLGKADRVIAGGGEELSWALSGSFDAMGAMSTQYNDTPETASRPYDANRDGFVISGGGGIVVLEDWDMAVARGANILAELVGYGATSDGADMVAPSGEGAVRAMNEALEGFYGNSIDPSNVAYVNAHGTSTPAGDITELDAISKVFGEHKPWVGSTKSMTGHALGAAGSNEAIYTLLMMQNDFMAKSLNIIDRDEGAAASNLLTERQDGQFDYALSNSFGFGGTNAVLVFKRV